MMTCPNCTEPDFYVLAMTGDRRRCAVCGFTAVEVSCSGVDTHGRHVPRMSEAGHAMAIEDFWRVRDR